MRGWGATSNDVPRFARRRQNRGAEVFPEHGVRRKIASMLRLIRVVALGMLVSAVSERVAFAQPSDSPQAREAASKALFDQGKTLGDAGNWQAACPVLQEAHDTYATQGTALQLANCYEKLGDASRAVVYYRYVGDHGAADKVPERVAYARERLTALDRSAPPPVPPIDAPAEAPVDAPPPRPAAAPPPPIATSPPPSGGSSRLPAFSMVGGGAATLAVGAVFGALALSQASGVEDACPGGVCPDPATARAQGAEQDGARTKGWISSVSLGAGAVALGVGLVLLARRGGPAKTTASARGVVVRF
ncbi:MAG: hypothetical protein WKG00_19815 [Polyangiaceae bacterium]